MIGKRTLFRLCDFEPSVQFEIKSWDEGEEWNKKNWGIYWAINPIDGERKIEKCKEITCWAVDMDAGTKPKMAERIRAQPVPPGFVVETKRGFQVYWFAREAKVNNYASIVKSRLIPRLGADKRAADCVRLLRVPCFWHCKDPKDRFQCKLVYENHKNTFTEEQMIKLFPLPKVQVQRECYIPQSAMAVDGKSFWERVYSLDCEEALSQLSGKSCVMGEIFTFRKCGNGNLNILVDGKGTSCWIDTNKKIGSLDGGGPGIGQWLDWYHKDYRKVADILKDEFKELDNG